MDCKRGIVTGVDVCSVNLREGLLALWHLERQMQSGIPMERIALDRVYDTGSVHCGLELLGITGYIPAIQFPDTPGKYGFTYNLQQDAFVCSEEKLLTYHRMNCNQSTGKHLRCYQASCTDCFHCGRRKYGLKQILPGEKFWLAAAIMLSSEDTAVSALLRILQ